MSPIVKLCGVMTEADARLCVRYGADIIGLVTRFPRPVPWNLDPEVAARIAAAVPDAAKTCVVTGGPPAVVRAIARAVKPDFVQLHDGGSLDDTARLVAWLGEDGIGVIKTLFPGTPDLLRAGEFAAAGVAALLVDPRTPADAERGGAADLGAYRAVRARVTCPVILAGGITPDNVATLVRATEAPVIDIMTGVESAPGVKDETLVAALFQALGRGRAVP